MTEKKPYQPKALFQRILEEHGTWLFQQGYHEKSLGARQKPGQLLDYLKDALQLAITQTLWQFRMEEFEIGARGVFGPKKDPVDFTFHYRYDPHRPRLELTKLTAQMYDESIQYLITNNTRRQLPPADVVHAQLSAVIAAQILENLKANHRQQRTGLRPR